MKRFMPEPMSGCWIWTGSTGKDGYGRIMRNSNKDGFCSAHRYMYFLHKGDFDRGLMILHTCDNKFCVNPDHLYPGTAKQNALDIDNRKRRIVFRGSSHSSSKLTEQDVLEIRSSHNPKTNPTRALARKYGVTQKLILYVINRKVWRHV